MSLFGGFIKPEVITVKGKLVTIDRPWVMGIINVTPDSFFAGSRSLTAAEAVKRASAMIEAGADMIDIGGCSTRPGSCPPSAEEELERLSEAVGEIRRAFPEAILSIDTYRASVAAHCIDRFQADFINDVTGGSDPEMMATVGERNAGYILTHSRGNSLTMDSLCDYPGGVVADVTSELAFKVDEARRHGIANLIVDPGFGFAKTSEQSYELLANLDCLRVFDCPILVGMSRKRMAREAAECDVADSLVPTVALNAAALLRGASIIRVHDVREGVLTARTIEKLW